MISVTKLIQLFGFILGGHDTSAATMCWAVKYMADNQAVQQKLRDILHQAFAGAYAEGRNPSVDEITKTFIPYLDATIEEINRHAILFPAVARTTLTDVNVLGYHIPKGVDIFMMPTGQGFWSPPFQVDDRKRSESSQDAKLQFGTWDWDNVKAFEPERWLKTDEKGTEYFEPKSGPNHLAFGGGRRGCFGRKLAYLQLRIIVVLLVWNLELQKCPSGLSSYSAFENFTRQPKQCFVKLRDLNADKS